MWTVHWKSWKKFKVTRDLNYIYNNESDKDCFARDDEISLNPKYNGYQCIKFSDKTIVSGMTSKVVANVNKGQVQELHKPMIKKLIWAADLD